MALRHDAVLDAGWRLARQHRAGCTLGICGIGLAERLSDVRSDTWPRGQTPRVTSSLPPLHGDATGYAAGWIVSWAYM